MRAASMLLALIVPAGHFACASQPRAEPSASTAEHAGQAATASASDRSLAAEADVAFQRQDWKAAEAAYERLVAESPANSTAWMRLGHTRHMQEEYEAAISAYQRVDGPGAATAKYNVACAYARLGQPERAIQALGLAVEAGFNDARTFASDEDLASLRADPRFPPLLAKVRAAAPATFVPPPEARQFDFWIGEWEVRTPAGMVAGSSRIEKILNGCALLENWTSARGGSGKSFNTYDPKKRQWRQHWIDDSGGETWYTGQFEDGRLTFLADDRAADGKPIVRRMSFFDLEGDAVRQWGEQSEDAGMSWKTEYDLTYRPKTSAQ